MFNFDKTEFRPNGEKAINTLDKADLVSIENAGDFDSSVLLHSATEMPKSCGFLWNPKMVLQVNCRGYVNAQFMQPEPSKYSSGPNMEAKTFIQPEHSYFTHHPGRFFYIKDEYSQECFSVPYEPMREKLNQFSFKVSNSEISWLIKHLHLEISIKVNLTTDDVLERWKFSIKNLLEEPRSISIYPYFSIGYMSWMAQSACFEPSLNGIVASAITPYQKVDEYFANQQLKDKTFLIADKTPLAWHANQQAFEGEGGLHSPDALLFDKLNNVAARYETPVAILQFKESLEFNETKDFRFIFGPAKDNAQIQQIKEKYFDESRTKTDDKLSQNPSSSKSEYDQYVSQGEACLKICSEDAAFDDIVNHWLPRQMFYHGDVNRLSTDPQTRNFIQDNMGMCYIQPSVARDAFILALSQQHIDGSMPDGILLHKDAELKYINQVPHADHCVWLPLSLSVYLGETGDVELLNLPIRFADSQITKTFIEHIELAIDWLLNATDDRGLSYIEQGDWCDPMNMVGHKGKGVSAWLSLATAYAIKCWCQLCQQYQLKVSENKIKDYQYAASAINKAVNKHLFHGNWFARGITDNGRVFGTAEDQQGKIYLNPQSWAMLSGATKPAQQKTMIAEINKRLMTPFGVMMLSPSYTSMVEDIGRITQKHPGVSENGSVYNHAAIFYAYALYQADHNDLAFDVLKKIMPSLDNCLQTGQLPVFVPNYYRGAYDEFPQHAGRSSQLFNTGTVFWLYRCIVEELCGLKAGNNTLIIAPKLPSHIKQLTGQRKYRDAIINFTIINSAEVLTIESYLNDVLIENNRLEDLRPERCYQLIVKVPHKGKALDKGEVKNGI